MNTPKSVQDLRRQTLVANSPNTPLRRRSGLNVTNVNSTSLIEPQNAQQVSFYLCYSLFSKITLLFRSTMMRQSAEIHEYMMESTVSPA